ncbi:transporter [Tenacibaculum salmonis]|uniref:transporter n=1 Tax=Tenacibaculum sp. P3-BQ1 TaxID=3232310 RepID=UPI0034DE3FBA
MKNLLKIKDLLKIKKTYLLLFTLLTTVMYSENPFPSDYRLFLEDCDACGCSNNGGSLGMGGILENNFIGVRYLHQQYESKDGIFNNSPKIEESFNTMQIWSRIPITSKLDVQVFVPYHFHTRNYIDKSTQISGLGDVSLFANYTLINQQKGAYNETSDKVTSTNHLLKIGGGIKLPTGSFNEKNNNAINPSFQLGTGSLDYIANVQYVYKYNKLGVTNYVNYYYKTVNKKEYKFGNQFNFNSAFFYVFKDNQKHSFVPSLGVSGEFYQSNEKFNLDIKNTKGHALFTNIGFEYNTEKITFGALGMYPINQNLAQGTIEVKYRTSLYFNYNF